MKTIFASLGAIYLSATAATAAPRTSANYSISIESLDGAGTVATSAQYFIDGSSLGAISKAVDSSANYANKTGYSGQQPNATGLTISLTPATISEGASRQLAAQQSLDDATQTALAGSAVTWSVTSGPITSISTSGLAIAGTVYQDTGAVIGGSAASFGGSLPLTVLNTNTDDYGSYANDGIDDSWQIQYFGQNNPNAAPNVDADGTGQTNLFKFTAGLNPLDGSRFILNIAPVPGQPSQKNLVFNPIVSGRTYTAQYAADLSSWNPLTGATQSDNGNVRTVTDPNATGAKKFYRIQISRP